MDENLSLDKEGGHGSTKKMWLLFINVIKFELYAVSTGKPLRVNM